MNINKFFLVTMIIIQSCIGTGNKQETQGVLAYEEIPTEKEVAGYKVRSDTVDICVSNDVTFLIECCFENDSILLFSKNKVLLDKHITTDYILGLAEEISVKKKSIDKISIKFNDYDTLVLGFVSNYDYVYISKKIESNVINIYQTNKRHLYK